MIHKPWIEIWRQAEDFMRGLLARPQNVSRPITFTHEIGWTGYDREADERRKRAMICDFAMRQVGDKYVLGYEVPVSAHDSDTWDCSELIEVSYREAGLVIPDGSFAQFDFCRPIQEPMPGDLGFLWNERLGRIGHVELYLGNSQILGAVGGSVGKVRITDRGWIGSNPRFRGWRRHPDFSCPTGDRA